MAYINGNKPIVTDGLVYALDFGNPKSYTSGSSYAYPLNFRLIETSSIFQPFTLSNGALQYEPPTAFNTFYRYIATTGSIFNFDTPSQFTLSFVVKVDTSGSFILDNTHNQNFGMEITTSSLSLGYYDPQYEKYYTRTYPFPSSTSSQHIVCQYSQGTFNIYLNSLPLTASSQGIVIESMFTSSYSSQVIFSNNNQTLTVGSPVNGIATTSLDSYKVQSFFGNLSQMYIYNRALSYNEIYEIYNILQPRYGLPQVARNTVDKDATNYLQQIRNTDPIVSNAIQVFIQGLKTNNLWDKIFVAYPFINSSSINLKEPSLNSLILTGSWSSSFQGVIPLTGSPYGIIPSINYPTILTSSLHLSYLTYSPIIGQPTTLIGNQQYSRAIGGQIVQSGSKTYHIYRTTGTSSFKSVDPSLTSVEVLVVAGGGSGGPTIGGGGGAGGLISSASYTITPGTSYPVVVGEGGDYRAGNFGPTINGKNSIFDTLVSFGGGGAGYGIDRGTDQPGANGGSGGGGGSERFGNAITNLSGGLAIPGQGFNGGAGTASYLPGGGGGSSQAGADGFDPIRPGQGGSGSYFAQYAGLGLGSPAGWFAGGGGASGRLGGPGGSGNSTNKTGVRNTGGGGGGSSTQGGSGGSGIVIVSYDTSPIYYTGSTKLVQTETGLSGSIGNQIQGGISSTGTVGFAVISRTSNSSLTIHKNNLSSSLNIPVSESIEGNLYLNAININTTASEFSPYQISYASIGAGLTTSEVSTYYNLVTQLQNNLKRQNTLLDNFSGAAAAYSLRRIGPSGYFGPAIRVRRDSDNALRDIGFTSDGQLDTVGLLDFVGVTGSGFVETWYDQSGNNNNVTQGTSANQPLVLSSGSILIQGKKPVIYFDGVNDQLNGTTLSNYVTNNIFTNIAVFNPISLTTNGSQLENNDAVWMDGTSGYAGLYFKSTGNLFQGVWDGNTKQVSRPITANQQIISFSELSQGTLKLGINNTVFSSGSTGNIQILSNNLTIARSQVWSEINLQELLFYKTSQIANRDILESNINSNYKIYGSATASFDPDYSAFITATGITQPTQSAALETLVSDLKSYGLWNKMKAIYPMITDRNNRFAYSEEFDNGQWNKVGTTVTPNASPSPLGTTTGDSVIEDTSTGEHYIYQTIADGLVTGSEYVASIYGRFFNRPWIAIETNTGAKAWFNIQTGITGSLTGSRSVITAVSGGWYRCALYFTSSVASGPQNIQYHLADADNNLTYTGISGTGSYMWGAQFENGNVLGPYRATTTSGFTTGSMLDQMKFNLRNPVDTDAGFRLVYNGNWNPGYSGVKPDGVTAYGDTKLIPSSSLIQNNTHISLYSRTDALTPAIDMGSWNGSTRLLMTLNYYNGSTGIGFEADHYLEATSRVAASNSDSRGFYSSVRISSNSHKAYKNNIQLGVTNTSTPGSIANLTLPIWIGASSNTGVFKGYSTKEFGFTTIGDGLTDYEAKALYWIVQKYQTTLGRQVY